MAANATINTKVNPEDKERFTRTAEALGMNASTALKVFVLKFNECNGFPFDVRRDPRVKYANTSILHAEMQGNRLVVPAAWRDNDDDEQ